MNSEYIVCLQNFDTKFFSTSEGPRPHWGAIFSIVEIFWNFVFLVMWPHIHTQYIVSSRNLDKKLPVPLWSMGPL